jgi:aminoglycoside N3'-acetyltransferase
MSNTNGATAHVTRKDVSDGLLSIGMSAGDTVVVHSSLSKFGTVEDGPDAVIDALQNVITSEGTIVLPTFSAHTHYFAEALALVRGVNGTGSGVGIVFEGSLRELYDAMVPLSEAVEPGWDFPFTDTADLWGHLKGDGLDRLGWDIALLRDDQERVRLTRNAAPLTAEDVVPWRMPVWTGAIPARLSTRADAKRSHQYSGSFTAWGHLTDCFIGDHDNRPDQSLSSHPLHRAKEAGGKIALLGVDHTSNSTIHIAQQVVLANRNLALVGGGTEFVGNFQNVDKPLDACGGQQRGVIGQADVRLVDTARLYDVVDRILGERVAEGLVIER